MRENSKNWELKLTKKTKKNCLQKWILDACDLHQLCSFKCFKVGVFRWPSPPCTSSSFALLEQQDRESIIIMKSSLVIFHHHSQRVKCKGSYFTLLPKLNQKLKPFKCLDLLLKIEYLAEIRSTTIMSYLGGRKTQCFKLH